MGNWQYFKFPRRAISNSIAAYSVRDAHGRHIGHLTGWICDDEGLPRLVEIRESGLFRRRRLMLAIGCIQAVNFRTCVIQLKTMTRMDVAKEGLTVTKRPLTQTRLAKYLSNFHRPPDDLEYSLATLLAESNSTESTPIWGTQSSDGFSTDVLPTLAESRTLPVWKPLSTLIGS